MEKSFFDAMQITEGISSNLSEENKKIIVVSILFLLFDIEMVFMYPWAVGLRELGWLGFVEMVTFMLLLLTGLIYIIKKGVLNWR